VIHIGRSNIKVSKGKTTLWLRIAFQYLRKTSTVQFEIAARSCAKTSTLKILTSSNESTYFCGHTRTREVDGLAFYITIYEPIYPSIYKHGIFGCICARASLVSSTHGSKKPRRTLHSRVKFTARWRRRRGARAKSKTVFLPRLDSATVAKYRLLVLPRWWLRWRKRKWTSSGGGPCFLDCRLARKTGISLLHWGGIT